MAIYLRDKTPWSGRGALIEAAKNADETELFAILRGSVSIDAGVADDIMADVHHADDKETDSDWAADDLAVDDITGPVVEEIDRRIALLGDAYPFKREGAALKYYQSSTRVYEFCLIASLQRDISSKKWKAIPVLFEYLSVFAVCQYLGGAEFYRTGWPSHDRRIRPVRFKRLVQILYKETGGEFVWGPSVPNDLNADPSHVDVKDEGVDFVAWKEFGDQRLGKLVILGQCACGDGWVGKMEELSEKRLKTWMNPVTYTDFVRAFSVPFHIPGYNIFAQVSRLAGLTLDRVRLARLAADNPNRFTTGLTGALSMMIYLKLEELSC